MHLAVHEASTAPEYLTYHEMVGSDEDDFCIRGRARIW
jgi:hypothetical protein